MKISSICDLVGLGAGCVGVACGVAAGMAIPGVNIGLVVAGAATGGFACGKVGSLVAGGAVQIWNEAVDMIVTERGMFPSMPDHIDYRAGMSDHGPHKILIRATEFKIDLVDIPGAASTRTGIKIVYRNTAISIERTVVYAMKDRSESRAFYREFVRIRSKA